MASVKISDITMKQIAKSGEASLTFKGKLEIAKLLDRLGLSVIEVEGLANSRADALRVKSLASAVKENVFIISCVDGIVVDKTQDAFVVEFFEDFFRRSGIFVFFFSAGGGGNHADGCQKPVGNSFTCHIR